MRHLNTIELNQVAGGMVGEEGAAAAGAEAAKEVVKEGTKLAAKTSCLSLFGGVVVLAALAGVAYWGYNKYYDASEAA